MSTYNTDFYNIQTGNYPAGGSHFTEGKFDGGKIRAKIAKINTTTQPLNIADIVNLMVLPKGAVPLRINVFNDVATASGTVQIGVTGTPAYFQAAASSVAVANTKTEALTVQSLIGSELATDLTLILTVAGANLTANTNLKVVVEYIKE